MSKTYGIGGVGRRDRKHPHRDNEIAWPNSNRNNVCANGLRFGRRIAYTVVVSLYVFGIVMRSVRDVNFWKSFTRRINL